MEIYPSIDTSVVNARIFAFDKLDGSNIRAQWTRKNGFDRFGTRRRLLDPNEPVLGEAVDLILEHQAPILDQIFRKQRWDKATAFFEFYGPSSFAGKHEAEPHEVRLIEMHRYKQGIIEPKEYLKLFYNQVPCAPLLYTGNPNADFVESVRHSTLDGMTFEGVVCKGPRNSRNQPTLFKVKSLAWLGRLKNWCGEDQRLFNSLQ